MRRRDENTDARLNDQDEPWTAAPNRLLQDARLSRSARLLYCVLLMFADDSGQAFPSQRRLARALGRMTANGATARLGLFKVLILSSQESERQRGLRGNRPVRIGNVPIVQLTQARDGAVPNTAQPMPDHSSVQAVLIIRDITHPKDPVFKP